MKKRGQLTVFIIVGILIFVAILLFLISRSEIIKIGNENIDPVVEPIHSFVLDCIKQTAYDSVYNIGQTGGYFVSPELSGDNKVAYYFYEGGNKIPTKEEIEIELDMYVNEMLFFCTRGFSDFPDFEVNQGEALTVAKIENDKVIFNVKYPVTIKKSDNSYSFSKYSDIEIPVRLGTIYQTAKSSVEKQIETPEDICMSCLSELTEINDLYIDMMEYDKEQGVLFMITDENSKINGESYKFYYMNKY